MNSNEIYVHAYSLFGLVIEISEVNGIYKKNAYYRNGNLLCIGIVKNEGNEEYHYDVSNCSQWYFPVNGKWFTSECVYSPTDHLSYYAIECLLEDFKDKPEDYYETDEPYLKADVVHIEALELYDDDNQRHYELNKFDHIVYVSYKIVQPNDYDKLCLRLLSNIL